MNRKTKWQIGFTTIFLSFMAAMIMIMMAAPASAKTYKENGFSYRVSSKQAIVTDADDVDGHLMVPDSLGGFPVTRIAGKALSGQEMTGITLPPTLRQIDYAAFKNCKKLKEITFPAKLKKVDELAFSGCTALTGIRFNNGLERVGDRAFSNCIALKKVALPKTVNSIGWRSFEKCYKLSSVKLNRKLAKIGSQAFYRAYALKSITIPSGVQNVGDEAFSQCGDLARVKFANQKTKLGNGVFYGCESLKKAALPNKIKSIPESTFSGCRNIRSVTIPKRVSLIKKRAFYQCSSLKSVQLNSKVYAIGDSAFACSGIQKLRLNDKMQFIGNGAFQETKLRSLKLTARVTFIGNRVFANCGKLKTLYIPASVKGINPGAFHNCTSLQAIHVAAGNPNYTSTDGVLYDKGRKKLIQYPLHKMNASFRAPGSLQKIRTGAFAENSYLKHVTVSANTIGDRAFADMSALKTVTLQSGTVKIENSAFDGDTSLTQVTLPDSVSSIGESVFRGTAIKRIHIPSRLARLGSSAFENCRHLSAFDGGQGSHYRVSDGVLYNGSKTDLIKYPTKKKDSSFTVPGTVKTIRSMAFERTNYLAKIEFGAGLRNLNSHAVDGAKNLKSVIFQSKGLRYGSSYAIINCDKLAVIVGPNTYTFRAIARNANATLISL